MKNTSMTMNKIIGHINILSYPNFSEIFIINTYASNSSSVEESDAKGISIAFY